MICSSTKTGRLRLRQLTAEYKENKIPDAGDRYRYIGPLSDMLKSINKQLKVVRAEKRQAKNIKNYSERVSKIQQLQEKERKLVMMFNKQYEELRGED